MDLLSLLGKEFRWGRRELVPLFLLLVLLPAMLAYGSLTFEHVLPTDTPVAVVPQNDAVTEDDVNVARGGLAFFSDPVNYDTREAAFDALAREQVYAVVTVPPAVVGGDSDEPAAFHVYVDGSVVPYLEPSKLVVNVMSYYLRTNIDQNVHIERHVVGAERTLSEYLIPTFLMLLVMILSLAYLPYNLAKERSVIERLRVESSLESVILGKILFFTGLLAVPLVVFQAASLSFGFGLDVLTAGGILTYLLTFAYLSAFGAAVTVATRFSDWGRMLNVVVLFGLFAFTGLLYPAGFFSPLRKRIIRLVPTHYSTVLARGYSLRDADIGFFAEWLAGLAGVLVVALALVKLSVVHYERTR